MTPGLTKYATSRIEDIKSCFNLFLAEPIENIVISMTNFEGRRVYKENWNEVDRTDIEAYIGLLILCGVYKSRNENVASLWYADTDRATMSQQSLAWVQTTTRCSLMWFSIWQCQCFCFSVTMVRFVVPWYCLFDSVSVQDIYNLNITVLVRCSMKCYNVKKWCDA